MEKRGYVITHTHWDREWRYPIWESRIYLAEMLDELLDVLDKQGEYVSFLFDGQSVFLEDYLALRPENRGRLKKHIREKRLLVGPWYTLPDLYPVSGESLVRNLLKGDAVCREYGHKLNVGYESFGWGQPSQFPQIYKGFDIDLVIVAKRVSERRAPESEFVWEGKDGTQVLATRLGGDARANFYMNTYMEAMSGRKYKSDEFRYDYGNTRLYHQADKTGSEQDFFMVSYQEEIHEEKLRELALRSWDAMEDSRLKGDRVLMDGSDSTCAQTGLTRLLEKINEALREDGITLEHTSMENYAALMRDKLQGEDLQVIKGELRDGPSPSVSANALMTRYPVKRKNKEAEMLLLDLAEPLSVAGAMLGLPYNSNYLGRARDYLLGSQSHDSINGVVQEKTVRDVMYRLDQCAELAGCVKEQVLRHIVQHISSAGCEKGDLLVLLANPLPHRRSEVVELVVDTPSEQNIWDFDVYDMSGEKLECAHISRKETVTPTVSRHTRPEPFYADRHEVLLETGEIPAGGYKVVRLTPKKRFDRKQKFWPPTRMSDGRELGRGACAMENDFLRAEVRPNGTVCLLCKETGFFTGELNYLESGGDLGDYWIHYPPYHDRTYTSQGVQADIWMEENTPLQTSICASYLFKVPAYGIRPEAGIQGESRRSCQMTELPVCVRYTLKKDARMLDVRLKVENRAKDHRLSACFDTGIYAQGAWSGGHFCVDYRERTAQNEEEGLHHTEMDKLPMQGFVDISDNVQGFGVISPDLLEYDASCPGRLSCTLFRAVRNIICTEFRSGSSYPSQEGGQLQEKLEYRYSLMPHRRDWEAAGLPAKSRCCSVPVLSVQFSVDGREEGDLPMEKSFFEVKGAQVSCIKKCEERDSIIMRLYNVETGNKKAQIRFALPIKEAYLVNMKEERLGTLSCEEGEICTELGPDKIVTIEVR